MAVDLKALALFSLLFGAGLAIQFERLARSERRTSLLVRRLAVLLAFGLIHLCLIWNGDILTLNTRSLASSSCRSCSVRAGYWLSPRWRLSGCTLRCRSFRRRDCGPGTAALARDVVRRVASTRRAAFSTSWRSGSAIFPFSLACTPYLSGDDPGAASSAISAWRTGILRNPPRHLLVLIAAGCIGLGTVLILSHAGGEIGLRQEPLGTILLALGYGASIIGIANLERGKRLLGWAAPLGRMAFTNYLAQSVILGWIFYGYGLGLFGRPRRDKRADHRRCHLHRTGIFQRLVAAPLSLRPGGSPAGGAR